MVIRKSANLLPTSLRKRQRGAEFRKIELMLAKVPQVAPSMEPEGALRMFNQSVECNKLRYSEFFGDGDSKSYSTVKDVYEEDNITVVKKECVGHVQKRLGTALRKLKKEKGLGGKKKGDKDQSKEGVTYASGSFP